MSDFKAEVHKIRFPLELCLRPRWGSLQRSPDTLAVFKGHGGRRGRGKGRGGNGGGKKRGEEGGEGKGGEGKGRKGRGQAPHMLA